VPDATTNGTHGKGAAKVIEDHPRAVFGQQLDYMWECQKQMDTPGIPGMICVCHGRKVEREGRVYETVVCWGVTGLRVDRSREICCLGAADGHVGGGT
jgi:hypothetical protein